MGDYVRVEDSHDGLVATLFFADSERENQLCWAAVDDLADALEECLSRKVRVVIMASALSGHWLEHAWLEDLCAGLEGRTQTGTGSGWFRALNALADEAIISVAAISGNSSGGGAELAWSCDIRVAETQVVFSQIESNAGLTTGIGGSSRLLRLVGAGPATEMVLLGRPLGAKRLYELGAITSLVPPGQANQVALEMAGALTKKLPQALVGLKKILRHAENVSLNEALTFEQTTFQEVVAGKGALAAIKTIQAAYDEGKSIAEVHDYQRWTTS